MWLVAAEVDTRIRDEEDRCQGFFDLYPKLYESVEDHDRSELEPQGRPKSKCAPQIEPATVHNAVAALLSQKKAVTRKSLMAKSKAIPSPAGTPGTQMTGDHEHNRDRLSPSRSGMCRLTQSH